MSLGLSMTGGLYRPVYWAFHRLFTEVLGVYRGQRELVDLPSLGTQASGNARWEREQGSEVPSRLTGVLGHVSESLLWRPTAGTRHRIRRLRLSRDFLTRPPPHRFPILGARITALSSLPHPPTKIENSAQRQLTSRTLKPPPIGHFYEFLCRADIFMTAEEVHPLLQCASMRSDVLLNLPSEFVRMGNPAECLKRPAGPAHDPTAVPKHSAHDGFIDTDAFDLWQQHLNALSSEQTGFDEHAHVRHRYLCRVSPDASGNDHNAGANHKQDSYDNQYRIRIALAVRFVSSDRQCEPDATEKHFSKQRPDQNDPMETGLVKYRFSWNRILFDVAHADPRLYDFFNVAPTISPSLRNFSNATKAPSISFRQTALLRQGFEWLPPISRRMKKRFWQGMSSSAIQRDTDCFSNLGNCHRAGLNQWSQWNDRLRFAGVGYAANRKISSTEPQAKGAGR